jgi:hypothetical protein
MRFKLALATTLAAGAALVAGMTIAPAAAAPPLAQASPAPTAKVGVKYTIRKFVRHGNRLYAYGTAIARYIPESGAVTTSRQPFKAAVAVRGRHLAAAHTICPVLDLTLGPLDLNLLGLMVHLDRVHLTITADSNGGLLGSLLCSLQRSGRLAAQTNRLNFAVQKSGLATNGTGFVVTLPAADSGGGDSAPNAVTPLAICPILDLTLGPLDLNLLGLIVHLDTVHLTITADSEGGVLGSLLCSLAGSGSTG